METKPTASQQLWGTEFDKQFTKDMLRDLHKRATALIKRYERYTPRKSTDTTEDRVDTALMKLMDGNQICAMIGPDLVQGIGGFGPSVHEALRDLADQLDAVAAVLARYQRPTEAQAA